MTIIRTKAPLRISFAGGGTDLPSYYEEHGGAVLSSTINRYAFVSLSPRDDLHIQLRSLDFDLTVKYHLNDEPAYDGVLDLAKATMGRLNVRENGAGLDLDLQSDAPAGSGLGGSGSLTVAVIGAVADRLGVKLDRYEIAELAYEIERSDLNIRGGRQDQYTATFGGFNLIEFSNRGVVVNPLRIERGVLNDLEHHLMLCYTGLTRSSAGLIERQEAYYERGRPETIRGLDRLHGLAYEMKDALLRGRLSEFAELLDEGWRCKVGLNPEVTSPAIDEMVAVAGKAGANAAKLLGAGGGGYLLLFCEVGKRRAVREALERLGGQFADFSFADEGLQVWRSECR